MMIFMTIRLTKIGVRLISDYYGPAVGYTTEELAKVLGQAVLDVMDHNDLQVVWKNKQIGVRHID